MHHHGETRTSGGGVNGAVAVAEDEVVSLVGRAVARSRFPDLGFADPHAEAVVGNLDLDVTRYDERRLRASVVRTMLIDGIVADFVARMPEGLVVSIHAGLCTRFARLDNGLARWIELDAPPVAAFKQEVWGHRERHSMAASCSLGCCRWMECARRAADPVPILLVLDGSLRRASPPDVDTFLSSAVERMPAGTEMVLDYDARCPVRPSRLPMDRACLELLCDNGDRARFPRLRFAEPSALAPGLERALDGFNGVSRLFRGHVPSIAHLRFV